MFEYDDGNNGESQFHCISLESDAAKFLFISVACIWYISEENKLSGIMTCQSIGIIEVNGK